MNGRPSHLRGKLVVLAIFAMGLALGVVALLYRDRMPRRPRPMTRPTTMTTTAPVPAAESSNSVDLRE